MDILSTLGEVTARICDKQVQEVGGYSEHVAYQQESQIGNGGALVITTEAATEANTSAIEVQGSADGEDWYRIPYLDATNTDEVDVSRATLMITGSQTMTLILGQNFYYRYVRLLFVSGDAAVTADVFL